MIDVTMHNHSSTNRGVYKIKHRARRICIDKEQNNMQVQIQLAVVIHLSSFLSFFGSSQKIKK